MGGDYERAVIDLLAFFPEQYRSVVRERLQGIEAKVRVDARRAACTHTWESVVESIGERPARICRGCCYVERAEPIGFVWPDGEAIT